ncbi:hypothetical protein K491DRAFT_596281 [Lophiostoma macrostomum CBS 122681]|uniref:Hypervirulence associated protein TUDOR domain-containing protein n=1 Tax=Lophiostoma macrostomum CBS 122681 TaxID=1314788 RepID=A0A6A6T9V8_9PLEO|nr:hypothetical protein K491DRAFT_596281 [Lophiostoma macrostomum CBS 122681]
MSSKGTRGILSKQSEPIEEGGHMYTKIRGGRHEGDASLWVEKIVTTKEEAEEENLNSPP